MAARVLVGLGSADRDEDACRLPKDVAGVEGGDFAGPHRGCVAEQDHGAVADLDGSLRVDDGDDLGELGDGEWVGPAARRDAHDPAHPSYDHVVRRIEQTFLMMSVRDAGAVAIERAEYQTALGSLGSLCKERSQCLGRAGSVLMPLPRHQRSHCPQAPAYITHVEGASFASIAVAIRSASPADRETPATGSGINSQMLSGPGFALNPGPECGGGAGFEPAPLGYECRIRLTNHVTFRLGCEPD